MCAAPYGFARVGHDQPDEKHGHSQINLHGEAKKDTQKDGDEGDGRIVCVAGFCLHSAATERTDHSIHGSIPSTFKVNDESASPTQEPEGGFLGTDGQGIRG